MLELIGVFGAVAFVLGLGFEGAAGFFGFGGYVCGALLLGVGVVFIAFGGRFVLWNGCSVGR